MAGLRSNMSSILAIGFDEMAAFVRVHLKPVEIDTANHEFIQFIPHLGLQTAIY